MARVWHYFDRTLQSILALLVAALVVIMFGAVLSRYVLNAPIMWAEEISRYIFVWLVYLGSAVAAAQRSHLFVDTLVLKLPKPVVKVATIIMYLLVVGFLLYAAVIGFRYNQPYMSYPAYTIPWFRVGWAQGAVPVGCILIAINYLRVLPEVWQGKEADQSWS